MYQDMFTNKVSHIVGKYDSEQANHLFIVQNFHKYVP